MNHEALMTSIHDLWAPRIAKMIAPAEYQPFLAALIANESGGDPDAKRFEPAVFRHLSHEYPDWEVDHLTDNSSSWGLTQIMGYHVPFQPQHLCDPEISLTTTIKMLNGFRGYFKLKPTDWENLFRCWNTGHPGGKTFDPDYVANGLARMQIWKQLVTPVPQIDR
jgi:hypothetical protein